MQYYDGYDDAVEPELTEEEEHADYVASVIERADEAAPLRMEAIMDEAWIDLQIEEILVERAFRMRMGRAA